MTVAVLFCDPKGVYSTIPGLDLWPQERDARNYAGPHPVVAHPPCQLWGRFARVNYARYGGEHNRPGNDGGCFASALASVRQWGGVLEHPAQSYAWSAHGLQSPRGVREWQQIVMGGFVCEVWQSAYGHKARKRTWLYYCGGGEPLQIRPERNPGTHQVGWSDGKGGPSNKPTLSKCEASATPIDFATWLIELARQSQVVAHD